MERGFASSWLFLEPSQNRKGKPCPDIGVSTVLQVPSPQRKLRSMAVKTGRKAMDPNMRWDRREEGPAMAVSYTHLTLPTIYSV